MSSSDQVECDGDEGKGLECILPAKQALVHKQCLASHLGDVCNVVVTTVTIPEQRSERKSRDPVGRLRIPTPNE